MTGAVGQSDRRLLTDARRWVIKVGSALLTNEGRGLDASVVKMLADQLVALRSRGRDVVLVSSGAIVAGLARLNLTERPREVHLSQAAAAVGQSALVRAYEELTRTLASLDANERGRVSAAEGYRVVSVRFSNGTATTTDVINAEFDQVNATLALVNNHLDLLEARARLAFAAGAPIEGADGGN